MKNILFSLIFIFFTEAINASEKIVKITDGKKEAKIEIIIYESLTCSHSADFHKNIYPLLKKNFIDNGIIKIEFRSFPLDLAALNA